MVLLADLQSNQFAPKTNHFVPVPNSPLSRVVGRPVCHAVLRFTAFWSFVREFPRGGLNWAAVRPVSRGTHLKQVIARLELAIWRLLAQRRPQLSR